MVPDARVFSSMKYEQKYPWLYDSVVYQGYLSKFCELFCELFCGHSSSSQEFVTVGITLVQYVEMPTYRYFGRHFVFR